MTFSLLRAPLPEDWSWEEAVRGGRGWTAKEEGKNGIGEHSVKAGPAEDTIKALLILIFLFSPFSAIGSSLPSFLS